jgi:hypothetical protein
MAFLVGGANSAVSGYDIDNSLRHDGSGGGIKWTPSSSSNRRTWTLSLWFKGGPNYDNALWGTNLSGTDYVRAEFQTSGSLLLRFYYSDTVKDLLTNQVFRDPSAWYHLVYAVDTTQGTDSNRIKVYLNGSRITSWATEQYPAQNADGEWNHTEQHEIGGNGGGSPDFSGYTAEVHHIDGSQKEASDFGEFDEDSGIWKPKEYTGSYGTLGFFLEYKQSGTGTNSSGYGADTSGNDNHLIPLGLTATTDQCTDTPTNNFATFNPLMTYPGIVSGTITSLSWSEGNTKVTGGSSGTNWTPSVGSIGVSSGKWYYEFYNPSTDSGTEIGGAFNNDFTASGDKDYNDALIGIRASNGELYNNGSESSVTNGTEWKDSGDILSVKLNMDDDEISFSTNGASYTSAVSITGNAAADGTLHPVVYLADDEVVTVNFGNPNWSLSSGNADANGYGNFEYAVPSGYYALCSKNLAEFG